MAALADEVGGSGGFGGGKWQWRHLQWAEPSGRCLKRLMGSRDMANDAMDVQDNVGAGGGRAAAALLVFVIVRCVCGWVPCVQKNAVYR